MTAKPKLIALDIGLALCLFFISWQARVRWDEARAERRANLNVPVKHVTPPPTTPAQKPPAVEAMKYADVATKNLFSKDRNPDVIVDAPKPDPPKVMPPLPVVYGVIDLPSGTQAIMSDRAGAPGRPVRAGDAVGDFKILAMDAHKVTFQWDSKTLDRNFDDLVSHSGDALAGAPAAAAVAAAPPPSVPAGPPTSAALGADTGTPEAPTKACKPGENSPIGTVVDGYRKTGAMSPFGPMNCVWVLNK